MGQCNQQASKLQGLEASMLVGVVLCSLHFAYEYSLMQLVTFTVTPSRSNHMLPFCYQQVLSIFRGNMLAVSVSGAPRLPLHLLEQHPCSLEQRPPWPP